MSRPVRIKVGDRVLLYNGDEAVVTAFDKTEQCAVIGEDNEQLLMSVTNENYTYTHREIQFGYITQLIN